MNNDNFVCFNCHLSLRYSKGIKQTPTCPQCHKPCNNLGDRCPVPPKNNIKEWQTLEADYRNLQKNILSQYQVWKNQLKSNIEKHLILAEQLQYTKIIQQDKMWLSACENLAETPKAYDIPFVRNWLKYTDCQVAWSDIGKPNLEIESLKKLPFNKERQKHIEKLWLDHNSLHIFDMFSQLWYEHFNRPTQNKPFSLLGKEYFFREHRHYYPHIKR